MSSTLTFGGDEFGGGGGNFSRWEKILAIRMVNHALHPFPYPKPIIVTSTA